jgi:AraC-like DNA-binding protein
MLSEVNIYDINYHGLSPSARMTLTGVSMHFVVALLAPAAGRGVDCPALLRQAGIDPAGLTEPAARVSAECYAALMRAVAFSLDDEFFGRDSRRMKVGSFAMLCHAVIGCRDLQRALARALRFYGLMLDDIGGSLQHQDGQLSVVLRPLRPMAQADLFAHENLLLFLHRLACWLVNRRIPVRSLGFAFAEPDHAAEYRLIFGAPARFRQPRSTLGFEVRFGALPVVRDEAALKEFLALAPENLFVRYRPSHGTALRVRRHLAALAPTDWPAFATLARSLGMSASTLHRRLAAEDSSFQTLKDQLRRERATSLLRSGEHSVMAVAEQLGFAEASAFHRAFRKWTGLAPGRFRRGPPDAEVSGGGTDPSLESWPKT